MKDLLPWFGVAATILAAGLWLGKLENRISMLERQQTFVHGDMAYVK